MYFFRVRVRVRDRDRVRVWITYMGGGYCHVMRLWVRVWITDMIMVTARVMLAPRSRRM